MRTAVLLLVLIFSTPSFGINYFRCDKTEDCAKAYGGCGRYFSVHRRYKELYEAKAHKGDRVAFCKVPTAIDKKYKFDSHPQCRKQRCLLILSKKEKTQKTS